MTRPIARIISKKRERGHAILELALSAGVMISCLAGTFQFGYTFYVYNQLVTAVGNGGRYAAMRTYHGLSHGLSHGSSPQEVDLDTRAIRNMVVYGDPQPAPDAAPVVAKLTPENVDVRWIFADKHNQSKKGAPTAVNVSIHDYTVDAIFKTFKFTGRPVVEFPYLGQPQ